MSYNPCRHHNPYTCPGPGVEHEHPTEQAPKHPPTCVPTDEVERAQVADFIAREGYCPSCRVVFRAPRNP